MKCSFLKTTSVHLLMCSQVERVRCICYMVAFNSFSSGSLMVLFGLSWIIDCLVLFLIFWRKMFSPPRISCAPGGQDNIVLWAWVNTDLSSCAACLGSFWSLSCLPPSYLPSSFSPEGAVHKPRAFKAVRYVFCWWATILNPKDNFL